MNISEFYEIVHTSNPLRKFCYIMRHGIMMLPWYYQQVALHFANGETMTFTPSKRDNMYLSDNFTRFWLPLRTRSAYDPEILEIIMAKDHSSHECATFPLYMMLYDLMLWKLSTYPEFKNPPYDETRDRYIPRMRLFASYDTLISDSRWVDQIIEDGCRTFQQDS